jgi:DNA uptake protein ComE-like DNA-binding protein
MKYRILSVALTAAVLLLSAGLSSAIENKTDTPQEAATKVDASPKSARSKIDAKHKYPVKIKLVDINSAKKEELKKLPGISNTEADKIIAGRPFGSKAWLVTNKIIPMETYQAVKGLIICKLSKKDIDKIMAQSAHENKK